MAHSDVKLSDTTKMEESIAKLKEIQIGLKQNLSNLHQKIEMLDSNPELKSSFENLRNCIETRASDHEAEVKRLREDLTSIRELLGLNLDKPNSGNS